MTCSCPKCTAQIEFDPTDIPAEGSFNKCSECGTNFVIRKESFARRALYKSDGISCAECGSHPGSSIYCENCHAIYPDFLVIEASSTAKRRIKKLLASFNILKNLNLGGAAKPSHETYAAAPSKPGKAKGLNLPGQPAQLLVVLVAIIAVAAGGVYYWYQEKQATQYTENYVRTLLGVKMARDLDIRISSRLAADMKTGASSALTATEQKSSSSARTDLDSSLKRINKVPAKFNANNESLKKLCDTYSLLHTTVIAPIGSSDIYAGSVKKIDDDFRKTARELKAGLPEKIADQLAETTKKFKELQDL